MPYLQLASLPEVADLGGMEGTAVAAVLAVVAALVAVELGTLEDMLNWGG